MMQSRPYVRISYCMDSGWYIGALSAHMHVFCMFPPYDVLTLFSGQADVVNSIHKASTLVYYAS